MGRLLACLADGRRKPRILTSVVAKSLFVMTLSRLGSLNALEQTQPCPFWRRWLGAALPSADTCGRVAAQMDLGPLREDLHAVYTHLKRNKALPPPWHGLMALVLDGHESHATERRRCPGCLERTIHTAVGDRRQYYHRHVTALLVGRHFSVLLDAEPQKPGEDEVATGLRLLKRLVEDYPRAFDVVLGDALYTDPRLYYFLLEHGKDVLTVLKADHPALLADARALFEAHPPEVVNDGTTTREIWDLEGFTSWPQVQQPVRVLRSRETTRIRRQLDGQPHLQLSEWLWVTTLSRNRACTAAAVALGHARWTIENQGFNETTHRWHADHVYKHHPTALLVFCLMTLLVFNLFYAFYYRNLKPAYRRGHTALHVARCLAGELYHRLPESRAPPR